MNRGFTLFDNKSTKPSFYNGPGDMRKNKHKFCIVLDQILNLCFYATPACANEGLSVNRKKNSVKFFILYIHVYYFSYLAFMARLLVEHTNFWNGHTKIE